MNYKTTIALIVLLAIVGAYLYFIESEAPPPVADDRAPALLDEGRAVFTTDELSAGDIDRITVERGDDRYVFAKEGDAWFQAQPVRFPLSPWAAGSLIDAAASLKQFTAPRGAELGEPMAIVTLENTAADRSHVLQLGQTTIGGRAMLQLEDDGDALLVNDALHKAVDGLKINELRLRSLTAPGPAQTDTFTIERPDATVTLRKVDGRWYLDDQHTQRAASDAVEQLINGFGRLSIERFVADNPQDRSVYGLAEPRVTVTLTTPGRTVPDSDTVEPGDRIVLRVGRPADLDGGTYFATRTDGQSDGGVVFTVNADAIEPFERSADDLRDPRLFNAKVGDVDRLRIVQSRRTLAVERNASGVFAFADTDPGFGVDYDEATKLTEQVLGLEASDYEPNFDPADEAAARITVNDTTVALYEDGDAYRALREDEFLAYTIDAAVLEPILAADAPAMRNRTVLDVAPGDIESVTLQQFDGTTLEFARHDDGDWTLAGHDDFEQDALAELLTLIAPLRAAAWPGEDVSPQFDTQLRVTTAERTYELRFGPDYGRRGDSSEVFALDQRLRDWLTAEFRPRTVIALGAQDIRSVTRDGQTVRLENNRFTWDGDGPLNGAAAAGLFDALAGMKVKRFVVHQTFAPEQPAHVLTIEPRRGEPIMLKLMSDGATATIEPGGGDYRDWFTLSEQAWAKLTAPLAIDEEAVMEAPTK